MSDDDTSFSPLPASENVADSQKKLKTPIRMPICSLIPDEYQQFDDLLTEYSNVFSVDDDGLGCTNIVEHKIDTGDHLPIIMIQLSP